MPVIQRVHTDYHVFNLIESCTAGLGASVDFDKRRRLVQDYRGVPQFSASFLFSLRFGASAWLEARSDVR